MGKGQIEKIFEEATECFLKNDEHLLSIEANERSLTHKFAEYLQVAVGKDWNVDCEYNRFGKDKKIIDEIKDIVGKDTTTDEIKPKTVYPDIIIHKRGAEGPNLLIIEAKKDPTPAERDKDIKKLKKIRIRYHYDFAVFLWFDTKNGQEDISFDFL